MLRFHVRLAIFSGATFFFFGMPEVMALKMVAFSAVNAPPVLAALQSSEFLICLVVSLSVSVPMFFELLLRIIFYAKIDYILPNLLTFTTLALPDLLILFYVRTSSDLVSLNFILKARMILLAWLTFALLKKYGGHAWSQRGLLTSFVLLCIGRILAVYKGYISNEVYNVVNICGAISDSFSFVVFFIMCLRWYQHIFTKSRSATITTDQYLCNIYATAFLLTSIGIYLDLYSSPSTLDWFNWNSNELTILTMTYTVFYIIVIVFEGRALQRDMLQTKVKISST